MEPKKINAIIVDDEKGCITNLQYYLSRFCHDITIIATGSTLAEGLKHAGSQRIDLAFLDIEIFDDNIFNSLTDTGTTNFKIVFVTAHQQYAFKAIKNEALDYILKPLCEEDIVACYTKIKKHFLLPHDEDDKHNADIDEKKNKKIIIKNLDKIYIIKSEEVYYMSGSGAYTEITFKFNDEIKSIVICKVLNKIEEEYENHLFFRVHKSHIRKLLKRRIR